MSSANKTSRLKLNLWSPEDSPLRVDFNSDNELIDAAVRALETDLAANASDHAAIRSTFADGLADNGADHAAIRSELNRLVADSSAELFAYARETRRLALDAYAATLAAKPSGFDPNTSEVWIEDFESLANIDIDTADTTARCFMCDELDDSIIYIGASAGFSPSTGDTYLYSSESNIALPFTLPEDCRITGLAARPIYGVNFDDDLNVTCTLYRATPSGDTYILGDALFTVTKARPTDVPPQQSYIDDYVNYVDAPFPLPAGTYCAVFYGAQLRANAYHPTSTADGNPKRAPYDRMYTLPDGDPSAPLTVTEQYYADAAVYWTPADSLYGILNTKPLGFDRELKSAALYLYCDTDDLQCECTVIGGDGASGALTADAELHNAATPDGLYVTKLAGTLAEPLSGIRLRLGLYSPSVGRIKRLQLIAMRTEL